MYHHRPQITCQNPRSLSSLLSTESLAAEPPRHKDQQPGFCYILFKFKFKFNTPSKFGFILWTS